MQKLNLALVGKGIKHSKSQQMYEEILNTSVDYTLLDYANESDIPPAKELLNKFDGISITAPYKDCFIKQVEVDERFIKLNAINCIGSFGTDLKGTNTDYLAMEEFVDNEVKFQFDRIVLLGDGAMARITIDVFNAKNIKFDQFSRKLNSDFLDFNFLVEKNASEKLLILNSCARVFNFNREIDSNTVFYDYNYSHEYHSDFFKNSLGKYVDGLALLKSQARHALKFWGFNNK